MWVIVHWSDQTFVQHWSASVSTRVPMGQIVCYQTYEQTGVGVETNCVAIDAK